MLVYRVRCLREVNEVRFPMGPRRLFMKRRSVLTAGAMLVATMFGLIAAVPVVNADDSKDTKALLEALGKTKHTLIDGVRQAAKGGAVAISAKIRARRRQALPLGIHGGEG